MSVAMCISASAQGDAARIEEEIKELVKKHEKTTGIDGVVCVKGEGLGTLKMMLGQQFGRKFMRGVDIIAIIDYSSAEVQVAADFRKEVEAMAAVLQSPDLTEEMTEEVGEDTDMKIYFGQSADGKMLTDLLLVVEGDGVRCVTYLGGSMETELSELL